MIQEDKELLLKDLSAKLPYNVKVKTPYNDAIVIGITNRKGYKKEEYYIDIITDKQTYPIKCVMPYLRPMSSMTEEEIDEFTQFDVYSDGEYVMPNYEAIDWLNAHHFDYRGLIERGLAIEVTDTRRKTRA